MMINEKINFSDIKSLPNIISVLRILGGPVVFFLLKDDSPNGKLICLIIASLFMLTDYFDGLLSRKLNQITNLGRIIDPIADKIFVTFCLLGLLFQRTDNLELWVFLLIVGRDVLILVAGSYIVFIKKMVVEAKKWGKYYTTFLYLTIGLSIYMPHRGLTFFFMTVTIALLFISIVSYGKTLFYILLNKPIPQTNDKPKEKLISITKN